LLLISMTDQILSEFTALDSKNMNFFTIKMGGFSYEQ